MNGLLAPNRLAIPDRARLRTDTSEAVWLRAVRGIGATMARDFAFLAFVRAERGAMSRLNIRQSGDPATTCPFPAQLCPKTDAKSPQVNR
jgi:hypothetical protein